MPDVNASWLGEYIRYYDEVDISIAVQTPNGLMVPILRNADLLGLLEINAGVRALAQKVRVCYLNHLINYHRFSKQSCPESE